MKLRFGRVLPLILAVVVAGGGAFGHTHGDGPLSIGTFLFPPAHAPHAPFVPHKEHPCAACAIANLTAPASAPAYLVPPDVRAAVAVCPELPTSTPSRPDIKGRSPPSLPIA